MLEFNIWAVLAAAVSNIVIGSLWYGPLFGTMWRGLMGFTPERMRTMKMTGAQAMVGGFVTALVMVYVLARFADAFLVFDAAGAWQLAFLIWLGLAVPLTAGSWLWEGKPMKLFVLNAAHWLVSLTAATLILAYWR